MADSMLPPSRFGAGYTVGAQSSASSAPPTASPSAPLSAPTPGRAAGAPVLDGAAAPPGGNVNSLAAAAFALVLLLGPFVVPLTIPMSLFARSQISRTGEGGTGLVKAVLALSCIYLAAGVVVLTLALVVAPAGGAPSP
jgi:hypothetical protein